MTQETFTLLELSEPSNTMNSTIGVPVLNCLIATSFSIPPFLYYATKAKMLTNIGIADERDAPSSLNVGGVAMNAIKQRGADILELMRMNQVSIPSYASSYVQAQILGNLLNDLRAEDCDVKNFRKKASVSLCITRAKKNVTIPLYLLERLTTLVQSETTARRLIHELTYQVSQTLTQKNLLDEQRNIIGEAGNSSWSRKVHNMAFLELLKHSGIDEISGTINMFNVKMIRERELETQKQDK